MNKSELVFAVSEKLGTSKKDAGEAVNAVLESISEELSKGEAVTLAGFGNFSIVERAARKGVNPATKKPMNIPASRNVKFKVTKNIKEALN